MKWTDEYVGSKSDLIQYLKAFVGQVNSNTLSVQAQPVSVPDGTEITFKVKYNEDEEEGQLSIKVSWSKVPEE
ncbi:MAG: amphi-Trp domain-containing protein [Firmicutes bacterium]|nr:amphi-Trp domain-containing protein [Bacillota bacterium]